MSENKTAVHAICATKYQTYLENQLNNFWTRNNSMEKAFSSNHNNNLKRAILRT
jgi:hypothetical protein